MRRFLIVAVLALSLIPAISRGADTPRCLGREATIVGTSDEDELIGTNGPDVIVGLGAVDTLIGKGGADILCAGRGEETQVNEGGVWGGPGPDIIFGGPGDDDLNGGGSYRQGETGEGQQGDDIIFGGTGEDNLCDDSCSWDPDEYSPPRIGVGTDHLRGGAEEDVCYFSEADVTLSC